MILLLLASVAPVQEVQIPAEPAPVSIAAPASAFGVEARLDVAALDRETAREDVAQLATAEQAAGVNNNTINGSSVTGQVSIDGQAFQGMQGLTIVNANTGNNVAINSALNVNVHFTPTP